MKSKINTNIKDMIIKQLTAEKVKQIQNKLIASGVVVSTDKIVEDILEVINNPKEMRHILKDTKKNN